MGNRYPNTPISMSRGWWRCIADGVFEKGIPRAGFTVIYFFKNRSLAGSRPELSSCNGTTRCKHHVYTWSHDNAKYLILPKKFLHFKLYIQQGCLIYSDCMIRSRGIGYEGFPADIVDSSFFLVKSNAVLSARGGVAFKNNNVIT